MNIHIVTINIKASNNPLATLDFMRRYKTEAATTPVVFCLQELDINAQRSGSVDVPKILADGDAYIFAPTISFEARNATIPEYGIASFVSNARIKSHKVVQLGPAEKIFWEKYSSSASFCWEREPRAAILLEVGIGQNSFWVINTHLAHKSDRSTHSEYRLAQIGVLHRAIKSTIPPKAPITIAGDFNATPDNPDLWYFQNEYTMAFVNKPTKITKAGLVQVDHCFFRNVLSARRPRVMPTTFSDHRAVACEFIY